MGNNEYDHRIHFKRHLPRLAELVVGYACFNPLDITNSTVPIRAELVERRSMAHRLFGEKSIHRTPVLCRLFMESVRECEENSCIAVPAACEYGADPKFMFITEKSTVRTSGFKNVLRFLSVKVSSFQPVTSVALQACLTFSIQSWLAPDWNRVGHKLIQGDHFLSTVGRMPAVDWELSVQGDEVILSLAVSYTHARPSEVDDFLRDPKVVEKLLVNNDTVILGPSDEYTCYVLPSEKQARLCSISPALPPTCPFTSNEELYQNWRLAYGYSSVDGERSSRSAHLIANVQFRPGSQLFSYPLACIRENRFFYNNRCPNDKKAIHMFLADIHRKSNGIWSSVLDFETETSQQPLCKLIQSHLQSNSREPLTFMQSAVLKDRYQAQVPRTVTVSTMAACTSDRPVQQERIHVSDRPTHASLPARGTGVMVSAGVERSAPVVPRFMSKNERIKLTFARRAANSMKKATTDESTASHPLGVFANSASAAERFPSNPKPVKVTFFSQAAPKPTLSQSTQLKIAARSAANSAPQKTKGQAVSAKMQSSKAGNKPAKGGAPLTASHGKSSSSTAKSKANPHEDIKKVDALIKTGMLSKANISILSTWLRSKDVKISRQNKKADLIQQVTLWAAKKLPSDDTHLQQQLEREP
eukprot:scpid20130/ scgid12716/ Uncharacterized protein C18orf63